MAPSALRVARAGQLVAGSARSDQLLAGTTRTGQVLAGTARSGQLVSFVGGGLAVVLAGCAATGLASGTGSLEVVPAVASDAGFHAQALVLPYTAADIQHLVVKIYTVEATGEIAVAAEGGGDLAKDVPGSALGQPIRFYRLHRDTRYRLRGFAYKAAGTEDADRISLDASSSVDVTVAHDDRPATGALPLWLLDKTFAGKATSSIAFEPGPVDNAGFEDFGQ